MKFFLHPLSHYNSITEPRAWFLLSLLEGLTIDFPYHFILFLIDVYKDSTTRDMLIFPLAITRILRHASVFYLESTHFSVMCAIDVVIVRQSEAQLWPKHRPRRWHLRHLLLHPHPFLLLLRVVWPLRRSWYSFSAWMLTLTHSVMSCVRWTLVSFVLLDDRLALVASWCLPLLLQRHLRTRTMMMMRMRMLALPAMTWWLLELIALCHSWTKGEVVLGMRVVMFLGGELVYEIDIFC